MLYTIAVLIILWMIGLVSSMGTDIERAGDAAQQNVAQNVKQGM